MPSPLCFVYGEKSLITSFHDGLKVDKELRIEKLGECYGKECLALSFTPAALHVGKALSPALEVSLSVSKVRELCGNSQFLEVIPAHGPQGNGLPRLNLLSIDETVRKFRDYHGEEVAGYFMYLLSLERGLVVAGLVGFFIWLFDRSPGLPTPSALYSVFFPVWLTFTLKDWGWKRETMKSEWGSRKGAPPPSPHPWGLREGLGMLFFTLPVVTAHAILSFMLYRASETYCELYLREWALLTCFWQVLFQYFLLQVAEPFVTEFSLSFLGHVDNHTLENLRLRIRVALSKLVIHAPFIYLVVYKRDLQAVRQRLLTFLGSQFLILPLSQFIVPTLQASIQPLFVFGYPPSKDLAGSNNEQLVKDAIRARRSPTLNLDSEHHTIFTQLSLIACWGSLLPVAPLLCLLSNCIELLVDSKKLYSFRRSFDQSEGRLLLREEKWSVVHKGIAYVACVANALIFVASEAGPLSPTNEGWGAVTLNGAFRAFAWEHLTLLAVFSVDVFLPELLLHKVRGKNTA